MTCCMYYISCIVVTNCISWGNIAGYIENRNFCCVICVCNFHGKNIVRVVVVTWDIHKESGGELIMDTRGALKETFSILGPANISRGYFKIIHAE